MIKKLCFMWSKLIVFIMVLFVVACSTVPDKKDDKEKAEVINKKLEEPIAVIRAPVETQVFYMKPVVKRLLKKAKRKYAEEQYPASVILLERAIDISPNNPFVWQQLALVRLKQKNYRQAEQLAAKSNVLGETNNELRIKNWQIIAEAKRARK